MSDVTVAELDELCKNMKEQREKIALMEEELTSENKKLAVLEAKAVEYLEQLGRENYKSDFGTIGFRNDWRFNLPSSPEAWSQLFSHFKAKGIYDGMITVNSNKLNSYAKEEMKMALESGEIMDFKIPGLEPPKSYKKLTFRKG